MIKDKRFETMNLLMRMNRKISARGPKQGGPRFGRGQMMIIREILDNPGISQDKLAENLSIDKSTVAKAVKKLEEHGLIVRTKSKDDSRKYEITATDKAGKIRDRMKYEFEKRSTALLDGISEEELDVFNTTLKKIEGNIEKNREETGIYKKRMAMIITRSIMHNPGITEEELIAQTGLNKLNIAKALEKMKNRGMIKIEDGGIHPTERTLEMKKMMQGRRSGGPGRPNKRMF